MVRVLVVDDEHSLTELLKMALRYEGWDVRTAADGFSAVKVAREFRPDAIVLDIMLPDIDGLEVLQRVRADGTETPVLFLTAKDSLDDRIAGLTAGGDDYVTKPFSLEEVVARLRGLIRRSTLTLAPGEGPGARRRRPDPRRGLLRGRPRRHARSSSPRPSSSCCASSCATRAACSQGADPRPRVVATTSAARSPSSSSTSRTCARRSTRAASR